jgi:hypothetical protein
MGLQIRKIPPPQKKREQSTVLWSRILLEPKSFAKAELDPDPENILAPNPKLLQNFLSNFLLDNFVQ